MKRFGSYRHHPRKRHTAKNSRTDALSGTSLANRSRLETNKEVSMADHKFEFTLSGVNLSEEQKNKIASEIATVVTRAVVGDSPKSLSTPMWSLVNIHGGRMVPDFEGRPQQTKT
jgi:hypothetical protein